MKVNYWTKREVDILKMYYFNSTATELKALLPQRDINSIRKKARSLGMYVPPSLEFKNVHPRSFFSLIFYNLASIQ